MVIIKAGAIYELVAGREQEYTSPFAQQYLDQENVNWEQNAWKYRESDGKAMVPRAMLWGGRGRQNKPVAPKVKSVFCRNDRLYYVLEMSRSNGLFYYDPGTHQETRLFHRAEFQPRGLFVSDDYSIITTISNPDGTVHLLPLDASGKPGPTLTSGDCIDENPYRIGDRVYYQSTGIARGEAGQLLATSPSAIHRLSLASGDVETILSSATYDYLLPQVTADGTLYCIRAPYARAGRYSPITLLFDVVMFPWRLAVAIFGFLNLFSLFFAKKPLQTVGGPPVPEIDLSHRLLHNRLVNIDEVQRKERKKVAVSRDWKLIRVRGGVTSVVASNVLWFSLDETGECHCTDGYAIYNDEGSKHHECDGLVTAIGAGSIHRVTV